MGDSERRLRVIEGVKGQHRVLGELQKRFMAGWKYLWGGNVDKKGMGNPRLQITRYHHYQIDGIGNFGRFM